VPPRRWFTVDDLARFYVSGRYSVSTTSRLISSDSLRFCASPKGLDEPHQPLPHRLHQLWLNLQCGEKHSQAGHRSLTGELPGMAL